MRAPVAPGALLEVKGLRKHFPVTEGVIAHRMIGEVKAVDGIDFTLRRGETLGLVGESGCGKTTTGRCILLLERPTAGEIIYDGRDLASLPPKELRALRRRIQVIFQDPYSSLNPRMKVGQIIAEPMRVHGVEPNAKRRAARVAELLAQVLEQVYHLRLDRHVQCRHRLIADDELRVQRQCPRNPDSLPLPTRHFVRITVGETRVQSAHRQQLAHPRGALRRIRFDAMHLDRLGDDLAHLHAWVQRAVRILEDHLDAPAQRQ